MTTSRNYILEVVLSWPSSQDGREREKEKRKDRTEVLSLLDGKTEMDFRTLSLQLLLLLQF